MLEIKAANIFGVELWSGCNLRCTYCPVSGPGHQAEEADPLLLDRLRTYVEHSPPTILFLQCGGELTSLRDWVDKTRPFMDLQAKHPDMQLGITSNLQKRLSPAEVAAIARFNYFIVSIDSADEDLQRSIRPPAELRNAVMNIAKIRTYCAGLGVAAPNFRMNCVVSDRNAAKLYDVFAFAVALGFKEVYLLDVDETVPHGADGPRGLASMDEEAFLSVLENVKRGGELLARNGIVFTPAKDFLSRLLRRANGVRAEDCFAEGETRICLEPWSYVGVLANGTAAYCCGGIQAPTLFRGDTSVEDVVNGEVVRATRAGLLEGGEAIPRQCRTCSFAPKGARRALAAQVADLPHLRPETRP